MGLFDVDDALLDGHGYLGDAPRTDVQEPAYDAGHLDEAPALRAFSPSPTATPTASPSTSTSAAATPSSPPSATCSPSPTRSGASSWGGDALRAVSDRLLAALRTNGYRPSDLSRRPKTPFYLDEVTGLRLALVFLAVKPLSRDDRIEAVSTGVRHMSDEEAYYWFSKCSGGTQAPRAQKALRVLLGD